jgi:hypothetical protein
MAQFPFGMGLNPTLLDSLVTLVEPLVVVSHLTCMAMAEKELVTVDVAEVVAADTGQVDKGSLEPPAGVHHSSEESSIGLRVKTEWNFGTEQRLAESSYND